VTLLAFLLAALLATSGAVKVRSGRRVGLDVLPGTALELIAALGLPGMAVSTGRLPGWLLVGSLLLFFASSTHHVRHLRAIRRRRDASEGGRLAAYVRYLSAVDESP
jgi:hypothetical protein